MVLQLNRGFLLKLESLFKSMIALNSSYVHGCFSTVSLCQPEISGFSSYLVEGISSISTEGSYVFKDHKVIHDEMLWNRWKSCSLGDSMLQHHLNVFHFSVKAFECLWGTMRALLWFNLSSSWSQFYLSWRRIGKVIAHRWAKSDERCYLVGEGNLLNSKKEYSSGSQVSNWDMECMCPKVNNLEGY